MTSQNRLDRIALIVLQITIFLTPIFFIPSVSVPLSVGKAAFILYGTLIAFILWAIARLKDGVFQTPRSLFYASAGVLALSYALAGLFSVSKSASFAGAALDIGTLSFFLPSILLFALVPLLVKSQKDIFRVYATLFVSFLVVALFHVLRFVFGADTLTFGIFTQATGNFIGKWNDVAIFFGLFAFLSLVSLEKLSLPKVSKILACVVFFASLIFLIVIDFAPVWAVLSVMATLFFIYRFSFERNRAISGQRIPYMPLVLLVVSLFFLFGATKLTSGISEKLGTFQIEVRPSWGATYDIVRETLSDNPIFGAGPNRFSSQWLLHKPFGINSTVFWNVGFNYGIGIIPSLLVTSGILGFASALLFVVLFLILAAKALMKRDGDPLSRYLTVSSLLASLYLLIFSIIYVPSASIWVLTLAFLGLFVAAARVDGVVSVKEYSTLDKPAASFVSVLLLIVALISAVSFAYFIAVKFAASVAFQKGVLAVNSQNDLDSGERSIARAISLSPSDVYYQTLAELYIGRLNVLFADTKIGQIEAQKQFQSLLSAAIESAQSAVSADPTNPMNHVVLGKVFESVVPLNITGAYESAKKAYEDALARSPESPEILLVLGRLEYSQKRNVQAKEYIAKALEKKGDYADAIFFLSQIQIAENDTANAIRSVSAVATLRPTEPGIFFQLGILYYSAKDYPKAIAALEQAILLDPAYANAKYFLGLSYYQTKQIAKALAEFEAIEKTNPGNAEVRSIIENLEAGKAPFAGSTNATSRPTLPVRQ